MKFYIYAALAVLVLILTGASIFIFNDWSKGRYKDVIIEKAERYDLPPVLIEAMISSWSGFNFANNEGGVGLTAMPVEGLTAYQRAMMTRPYKFVCMHQHKPPHKKQLFEKREFCPVCETGYVEEYFYPEVNIEIGAWYLAYLRKEVEKQLAIKAFNSLELALYAYRFGMEELIGQTNNFENALLTEEMRSRILPVLAKWERHKKRQIESSSPP